MRRWISIYSSGRNIERQVDLAKNASDYEAEEVLTVVLDGREQSFNVEAPASGLPSDPLYVTRK